MNLKKTIISIALVILLLVGVGTVIAHYRGLALEAQEAANNADNARIAAVLERDEYAEAVREKGELNTLLNQELSEANGTKERVLRDLSNVVRELGETRSELGIVKDENLTLQNTIDNITVGGGTSTGTGTINCPDEGGPLDVDIGGDCYWSTIETNKKMVYGKLRQSVTLFEKGTIDAEDPTVLMGPVELVPKYVEVKILDNEDVEIPELPPLKWGAYVDAGIGDDGLMGRVGLERKLFNFSKLHFVGFGEVAYHTDPATPGTYTAGSTDWGAGMRVRFNW